MASGTSSTGLAAVTGALASDANSLGSLKSTAARSPEKAMKLAAREFEALFLNQVLKSMRESLPKDGPFASQATESYTQMFDRELSKSMAARGTGLATMIEKQLERAMAPRGAAKDAAAAGASAGAKAPLGLKAQSAATAYSPRVAPRAVQSPGPADAPSRKSATTESQRSFLSKVMEFAQAPASAIGLSPVFVAAQAALESGWGKHEIRHADGTPAHNLFGVKAGSGWKGATVEVTTTEVENGVAVKKLERFRAYPSYAEGLADYVQLLAGNSRYRHVVANGQDARGFAQALARSGYATDPAYGSKIASLIDKARSLTGPG